MIYINNESKVEKLKDLKDYAVIIDFDRTITTKKSEPSMGIIPNFVGGECLEKRNKVFKKYRPIELDYTLEPKYKEKIMKQWANESFSILEEYTTEELVNNSLKDANLHLRDGAKEFFLKMYKKNIPVVVMSAGVGNVVENFLKEQGCLLDNVKVISNFFEFEEGKAIINKENIIATSNKNYNRIPVELRNKIDKSKKILLFGDIVEDIKMINEEQLDKTITVGFLDYQAEENLNTYNTKFDIVITDEGSFKDCNNIF